MTREEKTTAIAELKEMLTDSPFFYLTDSSALPVSKVNALRRLCFQKGVKMEVAKNTLIRKALENEIESKGYAALFDSLHGPTTIMIAENGKLPAQIIQEFRGKDGVKPTLKAAYIDGSAFIGEAQLQVLLKLKSKHELVGEVIGLLQSPLKRVVGQLQSGGQKIAGIVKTLQERKEV